MLRSTYVEPTSKALVPHPALLVAVLLLTALSGVYLPYLHNPFLFDDLHIFNGTTVYDYATELWRPQIRWIPYATLAHVHVLTDGSIGANRLGNMLLHGANAIAVYVLLNQLLTATQSPKVNASTRVNLICALLAAALFAVHPVAVYGVGYLIQRPILMSTLFMLLMLITWTRWLTGGRNALWGWTVFWYVCSVYSKEHSVAAPALALLLAVTLRQPSFALARSLVWPMAAMGIVAITVTVMVKGVLGAAYEPLSAAMFADLLGSEAPRHAYSLSILTQTWLYFKYMFLWIFPDVSRMSMDMREPFAASFTQWPYWIAVFAFAGYALLAVYLAMQRGRRGLVGWLLAYPWIMFLTELSTVRVQEPFVLYRAYLWFPLFAALIPIVLCRVGARFAIAAVAGIVCVLVPLSWNRLASLSDLFVAWNDAARLIRDEKDLGALRIYYNRALALSGKGKKVEALSDLNKVIAEKPELAPIRLERARVHFDLKQYPQALEDMNASIRSDPSRAASYYARAMTLKRLGRDDDAKSDLRKSCELNDVLGCFAIQQLEMAGVPVLR